MVLAQSAPEHMAPLSEGYRYQECSSTYGGVAQRWMLVYSEPRQDQAQRTVNKQWLKHSEQASQAWKKLCRQFFACEADARQALEVCAHGLETTTLHQGTMRSVARYRGRGRPRHPALPDHLRYQIEGALASSLAARQAKLTQQSCFILATNELDDGQLPAQQFLDAYNGQSHSERGFRFLKDPYVLASSLYLKKPERLMALLMVMTVCLLVYAALEYRIRKALHEHHATFPNQKGKPIQNPTARRVFQYFVGMHLLRMPGEGALGLNLNDEYRKLLQLLGKSYERFYC